jgi:hypothetical protein
MCGAVGRGAKNFREIFDYFVAGGRSVNWVEACARDGLQVSC